MASVAAWSDSEEETSRQSGSRWSKRQWSSEGAGVSGLTHKTLFCSLQCMTVCCRNLLYYEAKITPNTLSVDVQKGPAIPLLFAPHFTYNLYKNLNITIIYNYLSKNTGIVNHRIWANSSKISQYLSFNKHQGVITLEGTERPLKYEETYIEGLFTQRRRVRWTLVEDGWESLTDSWSFVDCTCYWALVIFVKWTDRGKTKQGGKER